MIDGGLNEIIDIKQHSILAWGISWTEESGRLQSMGYKELDKTE